MFVPYLLIYSDIIVTRGDN